MQIKIFTIPILGGEQLNEELNVFLRSKKIVDIQSQLVMMQQSAFWSFNIKYIDEGTGFTLGEKVKTDYREVLDEPSFKRFSKMREKRKALAQTENIPAYAILTNDQMAELAKIEDLTLNKMKTIKGIGEKTIEKYGKQILNSLKDDAPSE
jgi:superfamily II DNA helicase RecQ